MFVLEWLLESDPAIRWQVLRDLVQASDSVVATERGRVATEGWGARLLALQGNDGQWAGGACFPAEGWQRAEECQPWTATLPTLELLRDFGIDSSSICFDPNSSRTGPGCWKTLIRARSTLQWTRQITGQAAGTPCGHYVSSAGTRGSVSSLPAERSAGKLRSNSA